MSDINTPAPYQPGETVDITIRGAKVASFDNRGLWVELVDGDPGSRLPVVDGKMPAGVEVTLVEPIDGAPQVGDLWTDHLGTNYVAYLQRRNHGPDEVLLHNGHTSHSMAHLCGHRFRMRLVYRAAAPKPIQARAISCQGLALSVDPDALTFHGQPVEGYADEMARRGEDHVFGCERIGHTCDEAAEVSA